MSDFRDVPDEQRFEQDFPDESGKPRTVFADYSRRGEERAILHVEAPMALRGSGAAGKFMQSLANHARAEKMRLTPVCGYAVAWFRRHPDYRDVLA